MAPPTGPRPGTGPRLWLVAVGAGRSPGPRLRAQPLIAGAGASSSAPPASLTGGREQAGERAPRMAERERERESVRVGGCLGGGRPIVGG
jgi:hypothetical protein